MWRKVLYIYTFSFDVFRHVSVHICSHLISYYITSKICYVANG